MLKIIRESEQDESKYVIYDNKNKKFIRLINSERYELVDENKATEFNQYRARKFVKDNDDLDLTSLKVGSENYKRILKNNSGNEGQQSLF